MNFISIVAIIVFILGYIFITLENEIKVSKSAIALTMGGLLWFLIGFFDGSFHESMAEAGTDIFSIVIFLLTAMSLVEILVHYRFFDLLRARIFSLGLSEKQQFLVFALVTFFLSGIIDNLTTTIVSVQISRKFFKGENLLRMVSLIVIAANAGGAFSPIGDVTTIMLWLAGKIEAIDIIYKGFLPSMLLFITSTVLIFRSIKDSSFNIKNELVNKLSRSEKVIVSLVFFSFGMPLVVGMVGLPPYVGLLTGLGIVWIAVDLLKRFRSSQTHLDDSIERFIRKTDIPSLEFFIGILLTVSALDHLHVLEKLSNFIFGSDPTVMRVAMGNVSLGFLSAVLDNVPLTAIVINILHTSVESLWILLAITVGSGGSLLLIGSASGVIAMGMVPELTFNKYFSIAFIPAIAGYLVAVLVWTAQYVLLGW